MALTNLPVSKSNLIIREGMTRDEWLKERMGGIGSSDAAAIVGVSSWGTPLSVWQDKTGRGDGGDGDNQFTEAGKMLEPVIAEWFAKKTGIETHRVGTGDGECAIVINKANPHERCTPDGVVNLSAKDAVRLRLPKYIDAGTLVEKNYHGWGLLEIKNTAAWKAHEWEEGLPIAYDVQVQGQLMVTGARFAFLAVLIGGNDFRWYFIERNEDFITALRERCARFWQDYVQKDVAPPAIAAKDFALLQDLGAGLDDGTVVPLDAIHMEYDDEIQDLKSLIRKSEERVTLLKAKIVEGLGTASEGVMPNGVRYTNKTQKREGYVKKVPTSEFKVLRRKAAPKGRNY